MNAHGNETVAYLHSRANETVTSWCSLPQALTALLLLAEGGSFVCKYFECWTESTASLVYLLHRKFRRIAIVKPITRYPPSRPIAAAVAVSATVQPRPYGQARIFLSHYSVRRVYMRGTWGVFASAHFPVGVLASVASNKQWLKNVRRTRVFCRTFPALQPPRQRRAIPGLHRVSPIAPRLPLHRRTPRQGARAARDATERLFGRTAGLL